LGDDPWIALARRYPVGTRVFGKVTNIADYGCFVEIEEGVEGLVHVSEMDWTNKNVNPNKVVALGDETEVMVLDIDEDRRRISLGMKQCQQNPWEEFDQATPRATAFPARSNRLPILASSSAWTAVSTAGASLRHFLECARRRSGAPVQEGSGS
jgi:ribosomal protein S1